MFLRLVIRIVLIDDISNLFPGDFAAEAVTAQHNDIICKTLGFDEIDADVRTDTHSTGENVGQFALGKLTLHGFRYFFAFVKQGVGRIQILDLSVAQQIDRAVPYVGCDDGITSQVEGRNGGAHSPAGLILRGLLVDSLIGQANALAQLAGGFAGSLNGGDSFGVG